MGGATQKVGDEDWVGDAKTGWRCLKFTVLNPIGMQYTYIQGGPYKGTARGGPDAGKDGFEICAEADFNEGGDTTLLCLIGKCDAGTKSMKIDPELKEYKEK